MRRVGGALLLGLLASPAAAAEGPWEVEGGLAYEALSGGLSGWLQSGVQASYRLAPRHVVYGHAISTRRFDRLDAEAMLGYYHPLSPTLTAMAELSVSPTHQVLPLASGQLELGWAFSPAWALVGGLRRTVYEVGAYNRLGFLLERYWGNWRFAYGLGLNQVEGAGYPVGHQLQAAYYYGDRDVLGLGLGAGEEMQPLGAGQVLRMNVLGGSLNGRHWFHPRWALTHEVSWFQQGALYSRVGLRLGLRHAF